MPNDNTLGAPTEGLGQTVTFAANGGSSSPQTPGGQRQAMRLSAQGGGAQRTVEALNVPQAQQDPTFALLAKMGGELLKPHIEVARTEKYLEGMQKAAQGEAITEIVNEQPWYSKIFGSTSLVDGARAYSANSKATGVAVAMEENMPELRKLSPTEFSKYSAEKMMGAKTGDATTDAMIMQQVSSQLPGVMKNQAKAHLRYQQEVFQEAKQSSWATVFDKLKGADIATRKDDSTKNYTDVLVTKVEVLGAIAQGDDMDPRLHEKLLVNTAASAIATGNFALFQTLEDSETLNKFTPENQGILRRAVRVATNEARAALPIEFLKKAAAWQSMAGTPGVTDKAIELGAAALDSEYAKRTGDTTPYVGAVATVRELAQLMANEQREVAREAQRISQILDKTEAGQEEQMLDTRRYQGVLEGKLVVSQLKPSEKKSMINAARADLSQVGFSHFLVKAAEQNVMDDVTMDTFHANIAASMNVGGTVNQMYQAYLTTYKPMLEASADNGDIVAGKYAGEYDKLMRTFHRLISQTKGSPLDIEQAAVAARESFKRPAKGVDAKQIKAVADELKTGNFMGAVFTVGRAMGMDLLPTRDPEGLANVIARTMEEGESPEDSIRRGRGAGGGLSEIGGYHWVRPSGASELTGWLGTNQTPEIAVAADVRHRTTAEAFQLASEKAGIVGEFKVFQISDDADKTPRFVMMGVGVDDVNRMTSITAKDIAPIVRAKKEADIKRIKDNRISDDVKATNAFLKGQQ